MATWKLKLIKVLIKSAAASVYVCVSSSVCLCVRAYVCAREKIIILHRNWGNYVEALKSVLKAQHEWKGPSGWVGICGWASVMSLRKRVLVCVCLGVSCHLMPPSHPASSKYLNIISIFCLFPFPLTCLSVKLLRLCPRCVETWICTSN